MYLEISARRSGKTERLILEAVWCVYETQQQVHIVTGNTRMLDVIKNRLDDRCKRHIRFWTDWTLYNVLSSIGPLSDSNNMFFFDEFDLMNELFGESVLDIGQYNTNYYYATTPKYPKSYALTKLMNMNKGHFIRYYTDGSYDKDGKFFKNSEYDWVDKLFTL
jgi:hypothetical protein